MKDLPSATNAREYSLKVAAEREDQRYQEALAIVLRAQRNGELSAELPEPIPPRLLEELKAKGYTIADKPFQSDYNEYSRRVYW